MYYPCFFPPPHFLGTENASTDTQSFVIHTKSLEIYFCVDMDHISYRKIGWFGLAALHSLIINDIILSAESTMMRLSVLSYILLHICIIKYNCELKHYFD